MGKQSQQERGNGRGETETVVKSLIQMPSHVIPLLSTNTLKVQQLRTCPSLPSLAQRRNMSLPLLADTLTVQVQRLNRRDSNSTPTSQHQSLHPPTHPHFVFLNLGSAKDDLHIHSAIINYYHFSQDLCFHSVHRARLLKGSLIYKGICLKGHFPKLQISSV